MTPRVRSVCCSAALDVFKCLQSAPVVNPSDGNAAPALEGLGPCALVVVLPQLGDFDSAEYAELLAAVGADLEDASIDLRVIGIGNSGAAARFAQFTGLPLEVLRVDPDAALHRALELYAGPGIALPDFVPEKLRPAVGAWVNYMAMCAGIGAPGTLAEILRGYLGDKTAPERLTDDACVRMGPVLITGTRAWKVGPLGADLWWKEESGYQRPVELATVRLRNMVEVLGNFGEYVDDQAHLAQRGGTFLLEDGEVAYEYRDRGVLTYSKTMRRPLSFLEPYIGARARNPLGLGDNGGVK
eukprot:gene19155-22900_t